MQVEVSRKNITAQLSLKTNKICDAEPKKEREDHDEEKYKFICVDDVIGYWIVWK